MIYERCLFYHIDFFIEYFPHRINVFVSLQPNLMSSTHTDKSNPFSRCTNKHSQLETFSQPYFNRIFSNRLKFFLFEVMVAQAWSGDCVQVSAQPFYLPVVFFFFLKSRRIADVTVQGGTPRQQTSKGRTTMAPSAQTQIRSQGPSSHSHQGARLGRVHVHP